MPSLNKVLFTALITTLCFCSFAQESAIRKNIAERIPQLKAIDEVNKTPIPGIFEIFTLFCGSNFSGKLL